MLCLLVLFHGLLPPIIALEAAAEIFKLYADHNS